MLRTTDDRSHREVLARALAELSTAETFASFADGNPGLGDTAWFRDARGLVEFRTAAGDAKLEAARQLIAGGHPWDRREAVSFLVKEGYGEVLLGLLQMAPQLGLPLLETAFHSPNGVAVLAQIRRMGYRIEETPQGPVLVRSVGDVVRAR